MPLRFLTKSIVVFFYISFETFMSSGHEFCITLYISNISTLLNCVEEDQNAQYIVDSFWHVKGLI